MPVKVLCTLIRRPKGGVETYIYNIHENIDPFQVQLDYLIGDYDSMDVFVDNIKKMGGQVYILPKITLGNLFRFFSELNAFYKSHREYRIIHSHSAISAIFFLVLAKINGIQHRILHGHNTKYSDHRIRILRNFFLQLPVKYAANHYFACSFAVGRFIFGEKNIKQNKVYIANNSIDANKFRYNIEIRNKLRKQMCVEKKIVLGHVGAFLPQKNHSLLIDIFNEVHKRNSDAVLLLVGTGALKSEVKDKVKSLGLDNVVFFLDQRPDVNELMQVFDVFLLPSLFEGLPLVGIEAQAAGLKCVMSDTITDEIKITDLVEFVRLSATPQEWADRILKYINGYNRRDTYEEILNAGYDVMYAAKKLQNFYLNLR